ncbi:MAG: response regulator, partial [Chloroflexi bacterium]|nr:response regulator [Chloroflexota bacterium]
MGSSKRVLLVFSDVSAANLLNKSLLSPAGHLVTITSDHKEAEKAVSAIRPNLLILSDGLKGIDSIELANRLIIEQPTLPIILFSKKDTGINPRDV